MSVNPIVIAGAGLAGLTMGRCLLSKGIRALIIDRASPSSRRHDYSMELCSWAYQPLLSILDMDEVAFRQSLSISSHISGTNGQGSKSLQSGEEKSFRCYRGTLESLLREGLDIRWGQTISSVSTGSQNITIHIEDNSPIKATSLIAADGVHSAVRHSLVPSTKLNIYPYTVFYGTRHISCEKYQQTIAPQMQDHTILESRHDDVLLQAFVNSRTSTDISLGYTYSRPARDNDPLHNPNRPMTGAKDIPDAFYIELDSLKDLTRACSEIFDQSKARRDRLLHWLMRSTLTSQEVVKDLADQGVLLIGDAVHAMPILGSDGGNMAMKDGVELAEWIAEDGTKDLGKFTETKYEEWKAGVEEGVKRLEGMHGGKRALL